MNLKWDIQLCLLWFIRGLRTKIKTKVRQNKPNFLPQIKHSFKSHTTNSYKFQQIGALQILRAQFLSCCSRPIKCTVCRIKCTACRIKITALIIKCTDFIIKLRPVQLNILPVELNVRPVELLNFMRYIFWKCGIFEISWMIDNVKLYFQENDFWAPDGDRTHNRLMTGETL